MGGPAPRRDRRGLRLRRDRGLVLPAAPGRRPAGGQTAHRRPPPAAHAGDRRLRPVGAEAADRARLGPRRARDDELAGDALDDRRGGAARAAPGERPRASVRPAAARPRRRPARAPAPPEIAGSAPCSPSGSRSAPSASFRASSWPCPAVTPTIPLLEPLRRPLVGAGAAALDRRRDRRDRPRLGLGEVPHLAGADRGAAAGGDRPRLDRPRGAPLVRPRSRSPSSPSPGRRRANSAASPAPSP